MCEKHKNATATTHQALKSAPSGAVPVSERDRVQPLRYRGINESWDVYARNMLEGITRVMMLDKVIEGKVKPSVHPFENALNEGACHTAACEPNHHAAIQFLIIDRRLYLWPGLEAIKARVWKRAHQSQKVACKPGSQFSFCYQVTIDTNQSDAAGSRARPAETARRANSNQLLRSYIAFHKYCRSPIMSLLSAFRE